MDKPKITVQLNPHMSKSKTNDSTPLSETRDVYKSFPNRAHRAPDNQEAYWLTKWRSSNQMKVLLPFLLATCTGIVLGICMLVLFRGQVSESSVATNPAIETGKQVNQSLQGEAQVDGAMMFAWQLGSFTDQAAARKTQSEFAVQGVQTSIRGDGPYQLFAGVATDKAAGVALEAALKPYKVSYYAKAFAIAESQGVIVGLQDAEAKQVASQLNRTGKLAKQMMQLALVKKPDASKVRALQTQLNTSQAEIIRAHDTLAQAGLTEQAKAFNTLHEQLATALQALQENQELLAVEAPLTACFVTYETLVGQLIKTV